MENSAHCDPELLDEWLELHREAAFHTLVARYTGLVYATAMRKCRDHSLAAEASQLTFIALAKKSKSLTSCSSLGGWLHLTAVMQSKNLVRKSQRELRKRLLLHAAMEIEPHHSKDSWQEMQLMLDDALISLSAKDREVLMLRFYRSLTVREVAATLGIATDAAQKRLDRATDRLRSKFARSGFQTSSSFSATMLTSYAAEAQAAHLSASLLASKAITAATISTSTLTPLLFNLGILMKSSSLIPPVLILIAATSWIAYQRQSLSTVRRVNAEMEQALISVTHHSRTASITTPLSQKKFTTSARNAGSVGGKQLIIQMAKALNNRHIPDDPAWEFLKQQIKSLSKEDLVAALDETAAQKLHVVSRDMIDQDLLLALAIMDPELTLNRYDDLLMNGQPNLESCFKPILGDWGMKNPEQAGAWLDRQIATGKYDSKRLDNKDSLRDTLEATLIDALLVKNNASAKVRLKSLSKESLNAVALKLSNIYHNKTEPGSLEHFIYPYVREGDQPSDLLRDCYEITRKKDPDK